MMNDDTLRDVRYALADRADVSTGNSALKSQRKDLSAERSTVASAAYDDFRGKT